MSEESDADVRNEVHITQDSTDMQKGKHFAIALKSKTESIEYLISKAKDIIKDVDKY